MTHPQDHSARPPGLWRSRAGLVAIVFLAVAAFLLLSEHRAHALGFLPFLLLLPCLLLHRCMHGGHAGGGRPDRAAPPPEGT